MSSFKSKKFQTKIRMFSNGSLDVNTIRAERSCSVAVQESLKLKYSPTFTQQVLESREIDFLAGSSISEGQRDGEVKSSWKDVKVNVFIEYNPLVISKVEKLSGELNRKGNIITANISLNELNKLIDDDEDNNDIFNVQLGQSIVVPQPRIKTTSDAPAGRFKEVNNLKIGESNNVIIGIIDVAGFDFSHPDFLDDNGNTRFINIWDQGGITRPSPTAKGFSYGSELNQVLMNSAITSAVDYNVPAYELEPQSQMSPGSHGTHVASIAAGNYGVCANSKIAAVLIDLPSGDNDRRKSFYDSTRIADAVDYLMKISKEQGLPVSINISLGTNGHAHDGTAPISRWIDSELKIPGRSVCVAAGNAGQEKSESAGDMGYIMGRIHTSGKIATSGLNKDLEWVVVGNQIVDISENELEIWYSAQDRFAVSVMPPGQDWIGPVEPGEYIENQQLTDLSFLSVYNELYHPSNGSNYLGIYLSPFLGNGNNIKGVPAGIWRIRLHGRQIRDGNYHGWIERDDPMRFGDIQGGSTAWFFPSYFYKDSNVDNSSISSLGCGNEVVCVANLDEENYKINISSSQGPTRDGRSKPDLAAPGTDILAANGFNHEEPWIRMTGTSMSSPYICGVIGLMLEAEKGLTAAQIIGILKSTAQPLPGMNYNWVNSAGYGIVQVNECVDAAIKINNNKDITG